MRAGGVGVLGLGFTVAGLGLGTSGLGGLGLEVLCSVLWELTHIRAFIAPVSMSLHPLISNVLTEQHTPMEVNVPLLFNRAWTSPQDNA